MSASPRIPLSPAALRTTAAIAAVLLSVGALTACTPGDADEGPAPDPTTSTTSDDGTDTDPTPDPTESTGTADEERAQNLADAVSSGNTAAIEDYLTDPTRVVIAASEADMQYSPVDAVLAVDYVQPGVGSWTFDLDPTLLAAYAASPDYGSFFPDGAIVGVSDAGAVISFLPNGAKIGTIFMAIDETLITG